MKLLEHDCKLSSTKAFDVGKIESKSCLSLENYTSQPRDESVNRMSTKWIF